MTLADVAALDGIGLVAIHGDGGTRIGGMACDSRLVEAGDLFAALRGETSDGLAFLPEAERRGAAAVLAAAPPQGPLPWLEVADARAAMGAAAAALYDNPAQTLRVVGVTGTNGKTTVATLVSAFAAELGGPGGFLGTTGYRLGEELLPAARTTPEAPELQRLLARLRDRGAALVAMEVSSHALALGRTAGLAVDVAVFTNLTRDHLDFHGGFEEYFAAKRKLFDLLKPGGAAVVNIDDPYGTRLASELGDLGRHVVTFAVEEETAGVRPLAYTLSSSGIVARVATPAGDLALASPLVGRVNLENLLAAVAAGIALGLTPDRVAEALAHVAAVPGRLERIDAGQPFTVLVDYAHTDDALAKVLGAARDMTSTRVLAVFGCGGGRDRGKRPLMGRTAARLADWTWLTSDNPRNEDPHAILAEVAAGFPEPLYTVIEDRAAAIAAALAAARAGDVVVIAGKGHEATQEVAGALHPFDDRALARQWLAARSAEESW